MKDKRFKKIFVVWLTVAVLILQNIAGSSFLINRLVVQATNIDQMTDSLAEESTTFTVPLTNQTNSQLDEGSLKRRRSG